MSLWFVMCWKENVIFVLLFVLSLYTGITEKKSEVKGRIQVSCGR